MSMWLPNGLSGLSFLFLLIFQGSAAAAALEQAADLYHQGKFELAVVEAAALKTPDGYALAAQATLVNALFLLEGKPRLDAFASGLDWARAGLAIDPDHLSSHLQAAGALGLQARARRSGQLARNARNHLTRILELDGDHALALAALAAWHGEVLHSAGSFLGRIFFGANRKALNENFDRAIALRPELASLQIAYAKTLLRLSADYQTQAHALLNDAIAVSPQNEAEALWRAYGQLIFAALKSGDQERLEALLDDVPTLEIKQGAGVLP